MSEFQKFSRAYLDNYDKVFQPCPQSADTHSARVVPTDHSPESPAKVDGSGLPAITIKVRLNTRMLRHFWTKSARFFGCIAGWSLVAANFCVDRGIASVKVTAQ